MQVPVRKATAHPQMVGYQPGAPKRKQGYKQPEPQYSARDVKAAFRTGVMMGASVALLLGAAVIWFWAVPTVQAAVDMASRAVAS